MIELKNINKTYNLGKPNAFKALDVKTSAEMLGVFKALNEQGITVIIITHDMEVAKACGRVIEISDGQII